MVGLFSSFQVRSRYIYTSMPKKTLGVTLLLNISFESQVIYHKTYTADIVMGQVYSRNIF